MTNKEKWLRILYFIGVAALIIGIIDPLEGSIAIAIGSLIIAVSTYLKHDPHWKLFTGFFITIVFGVVFLYYFSSLGGFGGASDLSWWWATLILPYPVGWLASVVLIIIRTIKKKKTEEVNSDNNSDQK